MRQANSCLYLSAMLFGLLYIVAGEKTKGPFTATRSTAGADISGF